MKKIFLSLIVAAGLSQSANAAGADDPIITKLLMNKFEILNDDENSKSWDGSFYAGYDLDKLYIYSQGATTTDGLQWSQNEVVYSRAIAPFWDIQGGIAYDKNADTSSTWAEVAIAGLAPYFFELRAALLANSDGNIGLRFDAEYDMLFTQKLILTPSLEADFYTKDDSKLQIGSGLSSMEAGLRLRYEFAREFAPYIGVSCEKTFGNTREYNPIDETSALLGVRFWF